MLVIEVTQRLIAVLIVVGLGVGVWLLWPRDDSESSSTTSPVAAASSTTGSPGTTTTAGPGEPTTTETDGSHVVETVEEAEAILRELLMARYEAIYLQDEDLLRIAVATDRAFQDGIAAFGQVAFTGDPSADSLTVDGSRILRSDPECLVVFAEIDPSAFIAGEASSGVVVMRNLAGLWKWMSLWQFEGDLWEADCDALLEPF